MNQEEREKRQIFKNLEKTKKGISIKKRIQDYWTKGLQLHWCYRENWDAVTDIFDYYSIDLKHQGPIITIQNEKDVMLAHEITQQIKRDKKIRRMAERVSYPLRQIYPNPRITKEELIDGTIFIIVLRLVPNFCLQIGRYYLDHFVNNGLKYDIIEPIFKQHHQTIMETQEAFDEAVELMVEDLKKYGGKIFKG